MGRLHCADVVVLRLCLDLSHREDAENLARSDAVLGAYDISGRRA